MSSTSVDVWTSSKFLNRKCSVKGCHPPTIGGLPTLHTYPKEKKLQDQWIEFVSKTHKNQKRIRWGAICSLHFKDEDFENLNIVKMGFGRRLRLKRDAVPEIYPQMITAESMLRFQALQGGGKTPIARNPGNKAPSTSTSVTDETLKSKFAIESIMKSLKQIPDPSPRSGSVYNFLYKRPNYNSKTDSDANPSKKWLKVKIVCKRKIPKPDVAQPSGSNSLGEPLQKKMKEEIATKTPAIPKPTPAKPPPTAEKGGHMPSSSSTKDGATGHDAYVSEILQSMYQMQRSGTLCDFSLIAAPSDSQSQPMTLFKVHRLVFAAVSEKIQNHASDAIKLGGSIQASDLSHVIEFVYTGEIKKMKQFSLLQVMRLCNVAAALDIVKCVKYLQTNRPDAVECAIPEIAEQPTPLGDPTEEPSDLRSSLSFNPGMRIKEEYNPPTVEVFPTGLEENPDNVERDSDDESINVETRSDEDDDFPKLTMDIKSEMEGNVNEDNDDDDPQMYDSANLDDDTSEIMGTDDMKPGTSIDENPVMIKQEVIDPNDICSLSPFVVQIQHGKDIATD